MKEKVLRLFLGGFVLPMLAVAFSLCVFTREITAWRAVIGAGILGVAWRLSVALSESDQNAGGASE